MTLPKIETSISPIITTAMNNQINLKVIILAAGKSERFEGIKLLAPIQGTEKSIPIIQHAFTQVSNALTTLKIDISNITIATGKYHQQMIKVLADQISIRHCPESELGLGNTIAQSVDKANNEDTTITHIMLTLADQVAMTSADYIELISKSLVMPDKIVCSSVDSKIMPPAIFPKAYFSQLLSLTGDKGAKRVLQSNKENLIKVLLPNAKIDIDTEFDLIHWHKSNKV